MPIPTDKAGQTVVAPLGGETIDLGTGGSTEQQKLAWEWVQGMQQPDVMEHVTSLMYYLPTKPAVTDQVLKGGPEYTVFAKETQTARSRTTEYGANYPKVSQAIWTAIQAAITGTSSVSSALTRRFIHATSRAIARSLHFLKRFRARPIASIFFFTPLLSRRRKRSKATLSVPHAKLFGLRTTSVPIR